MHVYGVAVGKSGSTSLARMFGRSYRSAHEVDAGRLLPIAAGILRGDLAADGPRVRAEVRRRNWRFRLDVDSAPFLNPLTPALVQVFDDARFVLVLRDCFSWLDSHVEWERAHPSADLPLFAPYRAALFDYSDDEFTDDDRILQDEGLRPVTAYLRAWAARNEEVLRVVPPDRLLVLRTEDLDDSTARLARFVGVPEESIATARANQNLSRTGVVGRVPRAYVVDCARKLCAAVMESYWGADWTDLAERLPREQPSTAS
jgi:hypothetical protein